MGEPQGPHRLRKLALRPGPLRIVPGRRPEPLSKAQAPEWVNLLSSARPTARLGTKPTCSRGDDHGPLPRSNRHREGPGGMGCCPAGPRRRAKYCQRHRASRPAPAPTSLRLRRPQRSMASTRAVGALCATTTMPSRRTRPRRLSITCASTRLPDTTFPLMSSTICRLLMPPGTMRGSSQRARIADHDHWSRCRPTC
jgi:hypothetical protein